MNAHQRRIHKRSAPKVGDRVLYEFYPICPPCEGVVIQSMLGNRLHSRAVRFHAYTHHNLSLRSLRRLS